MADLKKGQRVTHPSVNAVLIVNSPASIGGCEPATVFIKQRLEKVTQIVNIKLMVGCLKLIFPLMS
ncbi:hypothetical protein P4S54_23615 [Shewanella sp. PP-He15 brown]